MKPSVEQVIDRMEELGDEEYIRNEDFDDYSKLYESEGNLRWIWRKGVCLGKKMVVTGIVVSSAPFVLPPLVALSAIGFAFSLPAGFLFATFACTNKLMNTLLPMPDQPPYLGSRTISSDEEEYRIYNDVDEVDKGYEEDDDDDDIGVQEKQYEEDTRNETEKRSELVEEDDREIRDGHDVTPINKDEQDTQASVTETVEESGYEEDVGEYMDSEEQALDSTSIPSVMEGIREEEADISVPEKEGVEIPEGSKLGGRNEKNVEQGKEGLALVPPRNTRKENENTGNLADINEDELRNETTGVLERIRDEGEQGSLEKGKCKEKHQNGGIVIKDMPEEKRSKNLSFIPEEVSPAGIVGSEDLNETVNKRGEKGYETGNAQEQPEFVIERMLVVNVKASGDHTTTDIHQGTSSDEKIGTLVLSSVAVDTVEMADECGIDDETEVSDKLADLLNKGEDLTSESAIGVSFDYHEVQIETIPVSKHAETGLDQESTADSVKELANEEQIWNQIHAIRTIVGYDTVPLASCVDELKALYVFTGVELPASSTEPGDLADVNEKLHFLMSIVGVK